MPKGRNEERKREEVSVTIGTGVRGGKGFLDVDGVPDRGSTFPTVPGTVLEGLGIPVERSTPSEPANGPVVPVDTRTIVIRMKGQECQTPVILGDEGGPSLLGMIALGRALLAVEPHDGRPMPVNAHRFWES